MNHVNCAKIIATAKFVPWQIIILLVPLLCMSWQGKVTYGLRMKIPLDKNTPQLVQINQHYEC